MIVVLQSEAKELCFLQDLTPCLHVIILIPIHSLLFSLHAGIHDTTLMLRKAQLVKSRSLVWLIIFLASQQLTSWKFGQAFELFPDYRLLLKFSESKGKQHSLKS